ncbi:MAG: branched-chain-amino-acid transaminase [Clostridiales bacterium]
MIYVNGKFYEKEEAKISVYDHGLLYGDGVFEGIRIYNGNIFKLKEHVKRIFQSSKAIYLDIGISSDEMINLIQKCVEKNNKKNGYIRVIITRGEGSLGIDPAKSKKSGIIIIVDDINVYPDVYYEKGMKIITSTYRRIPVSAFDVRIKSLNYLNNVLAKIEAKRNNCLEALMLNNDGYVVECTVDNIFIVKNNILKTPGTCYGALEGITRNIVLELSKEMDLKSEETLISRFDVYTADEVFLTGTAAEIIPVISVDDIDINDGLPGGITKNIMKKFKESI